MFSRKVLAKVPSLAFSQRASTVLKSGRCNPTAATASAAAATPHQSLARRHLSFSFAGARKLDDLIKKELLEEKSASEIEDIWYTYHEGKVSRCYCWYIGDIGGAI